MLFKHSGIYMLAKFIPGLMALAAISLYTRVLSTDEYGLYTLIFTAAGFISTVMFSWLSAGTLRYWSKQEYNEAEFINTLVNSYLKLFVLITFGALLGIVWFWNQAQALWIVNAYFLILALAIYVISQNIFSAKIDPNNYAYLTISYSILSLLFGGFLAFVGFGPLGVITGITVGIILPTVFLARKIWIPLNQSLYNKTLFKKVAIYGLPLSAAIMIEQITELTDRFMLAYIHTKAQAGIYAVGYDLSGSSIIMIMSALNVAAYPVIIKLLENDTKEVAMDYFRSYVILLFGIAIPAVVGLNLVGPDLVHLLIGKDFQASVIFLLPWITSAILLMGLQVFYFDLAFQLSQKTLASVKIAAVIAVINLGLNIWLIPDMGMRGAAIATLGAYILGIIFSAIYGRKYFTLPFPYPEFIKIIIATAVMALSLWWLKDLRGWGWLGIQLMVGMLSYLIMILLFNILDIRTILANKLSFKSSSAD